MVDKNHGQALFAIWFVQFTQSICTTMPYSVVVFTVRDFIAGSSTDASTEAQVGTAAGLLAGVFSLAQFLSSYSGGHFADSFGRKPVILIGLASSFVSILTLGFSTTYNAAIASRIFGGLLNGYLVALKSSIAELFEEEQQAKALGYLSFGWGAGLSFGPVLGGFLMHPCNKYALGVAVCGTNGIFQTFPYLLPYLFPAITALISIACTQYMLPETHSGQRCSTSTSGWQQWPRMLASFVHRAIYPVEKQEDKLNLLSNEHDCFSGELELSTVSRSIDISVFHSGQVISRTSYSSSHSTFSNTTGAANLSVHSPSISVVGEVEHCGAPSSKQRLVSATDSASSDCSCHRKGKPSQYSIDMVSKDCMAMSVGGTCEGSDQLTTTISDTALLLEMDASTIKCPPPWHTQRILVVLTSGYGVVAFMFSLLDEVVPIFASTPRIHNGLGMSGSQLSIPFSVEGVVLMLVALFLYPSVQRKIGCRRCLYIGLVLFILTCGLFPACTSIDKFWSREAAHIAFTVTTCLRCVSAAFTFTSSMVLINLATIQFAGNQIGVLIGEVNGAAQAIVALVRGLAPFLGGYCWSVSVASSVPHSQYAVFLLAVLQALAAVVLYCRL